MTSPITRSRIIILLVLISSVPFVKAGAIEGRWNNPRDLDPVIISGPDILGMSGVSINELYVYAYNASENTWRPIPFQFDEKDNTANFWLANPDGFFNGNDELVFMAKDMGDQAPDGSYWIDDLVSQGYERVEITVTDTVDSSQAWAYVYRSTNSLPLSPEHYMDYKPDFANAGADTIIAKTYIQSDTTGGIPSDWILTEGTGVDILDRQKVRINLLLYNLFEFYTNEDLLINFIDTVRKKIGPVRVIREVFWHIDIGFGMNPFDFSLPLKYYPYSIESDGVSGTLNTSDHVYLLRQSFDLNPDASGMKFYNPYNRSGIQIDGKGGDDGIDNTLDDAPKVNWWQVTGNQGTYSIIFRLTEIGETRTLYYKDDDTILEEGQDTGDLVSWGDTGVKIEGTDIAGNISFSYKAYYLGPNKPDSLSDSLAANFENPVKYSTETNTWFPVELAFFRALDSDGKVFLEWATETETNNYGFEIQRKTIDDTDWDKIGSVKGQGTTTTPHKYSFTDHNVITGTYYYRLKQIDVDGSFEFSDEILVEVSPPRTFSLYQNYPNPFNPETIIQYRIPKLDQPMVPVELKIYNLLGDVVRTLVQKDQGAGYYSVNWDGKNNQGEIVTAGTYIYRLQAGEFVKTNKMLLLR